MNIQERFKNLTKGPASKAGPFVRETKVRSLNFKKVFDVFEKNYQLVPLETFGKDLYKTLVSTLLSARTKDEVTLDASKRLFAKAPDIKALNKLTAQKISQLIYPVGFYKTKAKYLKKLSEMVVKQFKGKIPETRKGLMQLPGVGRKTANLILNRALEKPAIAVDTHVHKISNLLGWVRTKNPAETEKELVKILPKKYWKDINRLFVSIGRQYKSKEKLTQFLKSEGLIK